MDCPVCKDAMIILELEGVEVDYCPSCSGLWLDAGELELLLGGDGEKILLEDATTSEAKRRCPICLKKMDKKLLGTNKVLIDACNRGHGLWFDAGELEMTITGESGPEHKVLSLLKEMFADSSNIEK